jgi:hypothetical protein
MFETTNQDSPGKHVIIFCRGADVSRWSEKVWRRPGFRSSTGPNPIE